MRLTAFLASLIGAIAFVSASHAQTRVGMDVAERALLRQVLLARIGEQSMYLAVEERTPLLSKRAADFGVPGCASDSTNVTFAAKTTAAQRASVQEAVQNFCKLNSTSHRLPNETLDSLRGARVTGARTTFNRCQSNGRIALTRVGFDARNDFAVAGFFVTAGPNAEFNTGCRNFKQAGTVVFRRAADGAWEHIGGLGNFIT